MNPKKKANAGKPSAAKKAAEPVLLSGGNPQIAKADGDAPVQAFIAAMPGWKREVGRRLDGDKEVGLYKRINVKVSPLGKGDPVQALTYQGITAEKYHIPPTQHYMDSVIQGAYSYGLSMMWISYLQSFSTQVGRKPRPPGYGDAAAKM